MNEDLNKLDRMVSKLKEKGYLEYEDFCMREFGLPSAKALGLAQRLVDDKLAVFGQNSKRVLNLGGQILTFTSYSEEAEIKLKEASYRENYQALQLENVTLSNKNLMLSNSHLKKYVLYAIVGYLAGLFSMLLVIYLQGRD